MTKRFRVGLIVWAVFSLSLVAADSPQRIRGKVQRVIDGDTIVLRKSDDETCTVRLAGIDAPESHQAGGKQATRQLRRMVHGKKVVVFSEGQDRYGRVIGHIVMTDVNLLMIMKGCAWHYKKYSDDKVLSQAEQAARQADVGIWKAENIIPPWEYRHRGSTSNGPRENPPQPGESVVYVTEHGSKYHTEDCWHLRDGGIPIGLDYAQEHYDACADCLSPNDPPVE